jgi:stage IV sporulation protein FB
MSNEKSHPEQERIFRMEISGGFLLLLSFTAFLCGGGNVFAAAIAAAFHELGHLALILLQGSLPRRLTLDVSGACLRCYGPEPSANQELLRAMAGPAAGMILWLVLRSSDNGFLSAAGEMSLMLSLVNLLPAPGLDGGRVLNAVLSGTVSPDFIDNLFERLGILTSLLAVLLGVLHSPQLFLYGLWLFLRMVKLRLRD